MIRPVLPEEYELLGQLCVDAFIAAKTIHADDPYVPFLLDTAGRVATAGVEVLVLTQSCDDGSEVLAGTVTMCPYGSILTRVCIPGEVEPRVLAVAPDCTRRGLATELVAASERWASAHGYGRVTVCVAEHNVTGHNLYLKLGFVRQPDRDWVTENGVLLQTYTKDVASQGSKFCGRCGRELEGADHIACEQALALEPPRYCEICKRRMIVQVTPTGWTARCKEHGECDHTTD